MERSRIFDIALIEKFGSDGLSLAEIVNLFDMLKDAECYPIEILNPEGESSAMGFISVKAGEKLGFEYDIKSDLGKFVGSILADVNKENEDCMYAFKDLKIWLSRDV